jgi:polysaccharide deacetylase 2 family uncharacterized protein YibQ
MAKLPKISLPKLKLPFGGKKAASDTGPADAIAGRGPGAGKRRKLAGKHIVAMAAGGLVVLGGGGYAVSLLFGGGDEQEMAEQSADGKTPENGDSAAGMAQGPTEPIEMIVTELPDGSLHFGPRAELRLPPKPKPGERTGADPKDTDAPENARSGQDTGSAEKAEETAAAGDGQADAGQLLAPPQNAAPESEVAGNAEAGDHAVAGNGSADKQAPDQTAKASEEPPKTDHETFVAPPAKEGGAEPPTPKAAPATAVAVQSILPPEPDYPATPPRFSDLVTFTTDPDPLKPVDPALTEKAPLGDLPRVASDGRAAWQHYARPATADTGNPKVAIVITRLGLDDAATETAIRNLPPEVTLAFSSTERDLSRWVKLAREVGHEVLIDLPMEPENFPLDDPGPNTLLTTVPDKENVERLESTLASANGYIGIATLTGGKFAANREKMLPILAEVKERGLMVVDAMREASRDVATLAAQSGAPVARADVLLDSRPTRKAIDDNLRRLEQLARNTGVAVAVGRPYPSTFERLVNWIELARKAGIQIVPLSSLANKQKII